MRAFTPGSTSDLAIQVLDSTGDLVSPFFINYSIVGISEGTFTSVLANQTPTCSSLGCYYASFTIPINWKGNYQIEWHVQLYARGIQQPNGEILSSVNLNPASPGTFVVPHQLGIVPSKATIIMTSGGQIWFQNPTLYDEINLYLVSSDGGITGIAQTSSASLSSLPPDQFTTENFFVFGV
jgi:hypothetical protein